MPLCPPSIAPRRNTFRASQSFVKRVSSRAPSHDVKSAACLMKGYANAATAHSKTTQGAKSLHTMKSEALTLLHKTTQLLPRVLESNPLSGFLRIDATREIWETILSEAHEDISATSERPAKIVVCGWDEWSGSEELVTALLAEPLSSGLQTELLEDRWAGLSDTVTIQNENGPDPVPSSFRIPSNYLNQFPVPVQIAEFRPPNATFACENHPQIQTMINTAALKADVLILVCNPLTSSITKLFNAQIPLNTIVVLTSRFGPNDLQRIIDQTHVESPFETPEVVSVDPRLALEGIHALQAEPHSISAIQKYQRNFVDSRLSDVTKALRTKLAVQPHLPSVRTNLALGHISDALYYSQRCIKQGRQEAKTAGYNIMNLRDRVHEALARVPDVFVRHDPNTDKIVLNEVDEALKQAENEMRQLMDSLTWWRMISRVDEISGIVGSAVKQSWCPGLEKKLIMQTGKLIALQESLSQSAFTLIATHPTISTAVLQNNLLQLKASPHYHLTPDSLTRPLYSRRNQIIKYPTARLHVTGQRAVLGMTGGILSGVGVGWAGWLGWLLGSGEGLLGFIGMDAGTAIGFGMLGALASVRWAAGRWEKSKKRWWQDWARAAEGLDRDLKDTLSKSMQDQVVIVAEATCSEMTKLEQARTQELHRFDTEIVHLRASVHEVTHRVDKS